MSVTKVGTDGISAGAAGDDEMEADAKAVSTEALAESTAAPPCLALSSRARRTVPTTFSASYSNRVTYCQRSQSYYEIYEGWII
jgi:hypothetical protein